MGLCTFSDIDRSTGMVGGHAYTLISAHKIKDHQPIMKIRNPWGVFEYKNGLYSDDSKMY
jgi:hypothetical protein